MTGMVLEVEAIDSSISPPSSSTKRTKRFETPTVGSYTMPNIQRSPPDGWTIERRETRNARNKKRKR